MQMDSLGNSTWGQIQVSQILNIQSIVYPKSKNV